MTPAAAVSGDAGSEPPAPFDVLAALHAAAFAPRPGWSAAGLAALGAEAGAFWSGARAAGSHAPRGELLGFALARVALDEAEILTFCRAPAAAGRGVGAALLTPLIEHAAQIGARSLFLEVDETNHAAHRLYLAFGFSIAGRRSGYYSTPGGGRANALTMVRTV